MFEPVCEPEACSRGDEEDNGNVFDVDAKQCPKEGEIKRGLSSGLSIGQIGGDVEREDQAEQPLAIDYMEKGCSC